MKKEKSGFKLQLHSRNKHKGQYDFKTLVEFSPELTRFVTKNKYNNDSINFFDPTAVKALNRALLQFYYGINYWDIPANYLCPPIPGRADYIHNIADLLASKGEIPKGNSIKCLDIGVGANCIYPIIGNKEYGWSFVGADIDLVAIKSANKIIENNAELSQNIEIRLQQNSTHIFKGIIKANEHFTLTLCNPPFHSSAKEAQAGTLRKLSNLKGKKTTKVNLNFGGSNNELWCNGGEKAFLIRMISESQEFGKRCNWFTSLVSKETNLPTIYSKLKKVKATKIETLNMGQGNKRSRIVAWSFQ